MKRKPDPRSWRDEIRELPPQFVVSRWEPQPIPPDAVVKGGEVRIGGLFVGRVNREDRTTYHVASKPR